jgi:hypothetical protein
MPAALVSLELDHAEHVPGEQGRGAASRQRPCRIRRVGIDGPACGAERNEKHPATMSERVYLRPPALV